MRSLRFESALPFFSLTHENYVRASQVICYVRTTYIEFAMTIFGQCHNVLNNNSIYRRHRQPLLACGQAPKWGIGRRQKSSSERGREREGGPFLSFSPPYRAIFLFALYPIWEPVHRLPLSVHLRPNPPNP